MTEAGATQLEASDIDAVEWGRRLRDWRKLRDLSQVELAARMSERLDQKIGQEVVSRWEQGKRLPTERQRIALARILEVSVWGLFPYPPDVR